MPKYTAISADEETRDLVDRARMKLLKEYDVSVSRGRIITAAMRSYAQRLGLYTEGECRRVPFEDLIPPSNAR